MNAHFSNIKALVDLRAHEEQEAKRIWFDAFHLCQAHTSKLETACQKHTQTQQTLRLFLDEVDHVRAQQFSIRDAKRQLQDQHALELEIEDEATSIAAIREQLREAEEKAQRHKEEYHQATAALEAAQKHLSSLENEHKRKRLRSDEEELEALVEHQRRSKDKR